MIRKEKLILRNTKVMSLLKYVRSKYQRANKWLRSGALLIATSFVLLIAICLGMLHLWLTDFPLSGTPVPHWISFSLVLAFVYLTIGGCLVGCGLIPPGGGRGRRFKLVNRVRLIG